MKIQPNIKALSFSFGSDIPASLVISLLPLLIFIFILGMLTKFGRETSVSDTQLIITVYIVSFILIYLISLVKKYLYFKNSYISSDKNGIEIYSLIIGRNKNVIPFLNIQSFEINQNFFERLLGLSTIYIYTKDGENFELPGFSYNLVDSFVKDASKEYGLKVK